MVLEIFDPFALLMGMVVHESNAQHKSVSMQPHGAISAVYWPMPLEMMITITALCMNMHNRHILGELARLRLKSLRRPELLFHPVMTTYAFV
jgi:hypothetical protein